MRGMLLAHEPFAVRLGNGRILRYNPEHTNPAPGERPRVIRRAKGGVEAQVFVGLSSTIMGQIFDPDAIRAEVIKFRVAQLRQFAQQVGLDPAQVSHGGTVIPALGYWGVVGSTDDPTERSVSITIMKSEDMVTKQPIEDDVTFSVHMDALAVELGAIFGQYLVILRLIRSGIVEETVHVGYPDSGV